jgi:hypothetical protein
MTTFMIAAGEGQLSTEETISSKVYCASIKPVRFSSRSTLCTMSSSLVLRGPFDEDPQEFLY